MFSLEPFIMIGSDNTSTQYYSNNITNYYQALCCIPKTLLLEFTKNNIHYYYFFDFLGLLSINYNDLRFPFNYCNFLLQNEKFISIFKNKSTFGICKSKLYLTNDRLIEISNMSNKYITSYYLADTNLIFRSTIFGIAIFYKTTFKYIIFWHDLNIPLLDYINYKRNYE
jgi:hypothetical protein